MLISLNHRAQSTGRHVNGIFLNNYFLRLVKLLEFNDLHLQSNLAVANCWLPSWKFLYFVTISLLPTLPREHENYHSSQIISKNRDVTQYHRELNSCAASSKQSWFKKLDSNFSGKRQCFCDQTPMQRFKAKVTSWQETKHFADQPTSSRTRVLQQINSQSSPTPAHSSVSCDGHSVKKRTQPHAPLPGRFWHQLWTIRTCVRRITPAQDPDNSRRTQKHADSLLGEWCVQ